MKIEPYNLDWEEEWDSNDNSIWSTSGAYHDEGAPFRFCLQQTLANNRIIWVDKSDQELGGDDDTPDTWDSLESAKEAIQKRHDEIVQEINSSED